MESEKVKVIKACLDRAVKDYQSEFGGMCLTYINDLESENERLKNCIATLENKVYAKEDYYNAVKDRALEVFANKLKEKAIKMRWQGLGTTDIDETLKEFMRNG